MFKLVVFLQHKHTQSNSCAASVSNGLGLSPTANLSSFATLGRKIMPSSTVQFVKRTSEDVC